MRRLGRPEEALATIAHSLSLDCVDFGALYERYLLTGDPFFRALMRDNVHSYTQIALDYMHAGCFTEAIALDEDQNRRNRLHCHHMMMALGYLGMGACEQAQEHFEAVLREEPHHLGAIVHRAMLGKEHSH